MTSNKSFVLEKIQHTEFKTRPIPEIGAHDVLVEVKKQASVDLISTTSCTEESETMYFNLALTWYLATSHLESFPRSDLP